LLLLIFIKKISFFSKLSIFFFYFKEKFDPFAIPPDWTLAKDHQVIKPQFFSYFLIRKPQKLATIKFTMKMKSENSAFVVVIK